METSDWEKIKLALHRAIENLPIKEQEIINYHFYDDIPVKEIAEKLNRSATHVYSSIRRATCKLTMQLNPSHYKKALEIIDRLPNYLSL